MNKIKQNTHLKASKKLIGSVISIEKNKATVFLKITKEMAVDDFSLAHGSFTFGLADYAAMIAINEPTVVLGKAEVKFTKPVIVNDELTATAEINEDTNGNKIPVSVKVVNVNNELVFEGVFICFILEKHILQN